MEDRWITDWKPSERFPLYTRANAGEVLPEPCSPLSWELCHGQGMALGWADGIHRWGSFTPDETDAEQPEFIACFGGYFYLNASCLRLVGVRTPGLTHETMDNLFLGDHPDVPVYIPQEGDDRPELTAKIEETMGVLMSATVEPDELTEDREKMLAACANRPNLSAASNEELIARARSMSPLIREFFDPYYVYGTASSFGNGILTELLVEIDPSLPGRLVSGIGDIDSAPPAHDMWELSRQVTASEELTSAFNHGIDELEKQLSESDEGIRFLEAVAAFATTHGARGPQEWDAASPTWGIDSYGVFAAIDAMRHADESLSPANRFTRTVKDRKLAETEARQALSGNEEALGALDLGLRLADIYVPTRERTKLTVMLAVHEVRLAMYELGNRMAKQEIIETPREIFLLLNSELDQFIIDPAAMVETIKQRNIDFAKLAELEVPFIINGTVPPLSQWGERDTSFTPGKVGEELVGIPGSPGIVTGKARVITDPNDPQGLEPGEILVAPITDPAWTPLFIPAGGVVVEVGAAQSHAMILSREFGVPCAASVYQAATKITTGSIIRVDGNTGTVTIVELA